MLGLVGGVFALSAWGQLWQRGAAATTTAAMHAEGSLCDERTRTYWRSYLFLLLLLG